MAKLEAYVAATNRQLDLELTVADINVTPNPAKRQTSKVSVICYGYHHSPYIITIAQKC